ncbi:MAG: hypothetical protein GVY09_19315 [Gammaproteobacteria bacterium]|jgi:hypothetical protein|nr:hypothetical protein [Gammaproteobacteria bacterium]
MNDLHLSRNLIQIMMQRFETEHLDRILALRDNVAAGRRITDAEQALLEHVLQEALDSKPLVDRFPEYQPLYARVIRLYREITDQALNNEPRPIAPSG